MVYRRQTTVNSVSGNDGIGVNWEAKRGVALYALRTATVFSVWAVVAVCSSAGAAEVEPGKLDGIWRSVGYGLAVEVEGDRFTLYETTAVSRLKVQEGDLEALGKLAGTVRMDKDGQRFRVMNPSSIAPITFERVERLPGPDDVLDAGDARRAFDIVWQTFDENYAFFELRGVDWDAEGDKWRGELTADAGEAELFDAVAGLVGSLGDNHVELRAEGFDYPRVSSLPDFPLVQTWVQEHASRGDDSELFEFVRGKYGEYVAKSAKLIAGEMIGEVHSGANEMLHWGMLKGDVGYLRVGAMAGYVSEEDAEEAAHFAALEKCLDRVMADLADARAMIVDVRFNGGGWDPAAVRIANRFVDRRRATFTKKARRGEAFTEPHTVYVEPAGAQQFTRPTFLMTSPMTASAAEIFTFSMNALPHVRQVGLPTMGIHSDMLVRHLPNGWSFSLSNEVYQTVDGEVYEKVGIPPATEVSMFDTDDFEDGREQVVARVLELVADE